MIKGSSGRRFSLFTKRSCQTLSNTFEKSIVNILTAKGVPFVLCSKECVLHYLIQLPPVRLANCELFKKTLYATLTKITIYRSMTGVTYIPLKSAYSAGMSMDCRARDKFHKTPATGERTSAQSFQIQMADLERQYPGKPTLKVAFGNSNGAIFENSSKLRASLFVTSRWPRSSGQTNYQVHHPP